ncbi:putative coat protein [Lichen partiti-like RNA virus 1]|nr:putative coat protein [Lichen partiti-like RNA virus 1]
MSQSRREKMINYDKDRRNRSGATSSQFGKVGRNVDAESGKPKLQNERFVERPKYQQDEQPSTSSTVRDEMDKIENDAEKDVDKSDFKSEKSPQTVRSTPATTYNDDIAKYQTGGAFIKAWTVVDHISIPPVIQPRKSNFIPNFLSASIIIEAMERCLDGNEELRWINPNYLSLPVRLYYAVLFYLQILKAKEAAKKITKSESTWYRSFKRTFPLESLPVVGPLIPYYSNIVSVKPNDDKYDYVYPDYHTNGGLSVTKGVPNANDTYFIQPNVMILAEMLRQFATLTKAQLENATNNNDDYFNDDGAYVPHSLGTAFAFAGIDFPDPLTVATSTVLANPAIDKSLPETKDRFLSVHSHWRKSKARDIPVAGNTEPYDTIASALRMTEDYEWFEDCIQMATIQAKFFNDSTNMSQIPSTGGTEVLISAHIIGREENYPGADQWYPGYWSNLKATFQTTRADTGPEQFLNSEYALTTASISWKSNNHPIGGRQIGHRTGPYWDNREFEYKLDTPAVVGRRIPTMIQSQFYQRYGDAS